MAVACCGGIVYLSSMSTASRLTLFASLRRDRFPFALLGALVLFLNALQPLAAAQMPAGGHLVLCTAFDTGGTAGAAGDPSSSPLDDCPICLIGNACGAAFAQKAAPAASAAFPSVPRLVAPASFPASHRGPAELPGAPPPAIRAPPLPA